METVQNNRYHNRNDQKCQDMVQECLEIADKWKWNDALQYELKPIEQI